MRFAIAIPTDADAWRVVRRAEELGFSRAWFYDTQMLSADPFVAMAAAAVKTTRIRLGTGVLIPSNRIAPVAANAFASLNKLAPGRIDFGIGTGFTGRRAMGLGAVKLNRARRICARRHGAVARGDRRGRNRTKKAPYSALEPRAWVDQHARSDPSLCRSLGPASAPLDGEAGRRLDCYFRRCPSDGRNARVVAGLGAPSQDTRCGGGNGRRCAGGGRTCRLTAFHRAGRAARSDAVAPRRRCGTGGVADDGADAAVGCRDRGRLCRPGPQIHAAGRSLSRKPPRPPDVRQARRTPVHDCRAYPPDDVHRDREGAQGPHSRARRYRLRGDCLANRARPGARDRRLGTDPRRLPLAAARSRPAGSDCGGAGADIQLWPLGQPSVLPAEHVETAIDHRANEDRTAVF